MMRPIVDGIGTALLSSALVVKNTGEVSEIGWDDNFADAGLVFKKLRKVCNIFSAR